MYVYILEPPKWLTTDTCSDSSFRPILAFIIFLQWLHFGTYFHCNIFFILFFDL